MNEGRQQSPNGEPHAPLGGERLAAARRAHEISATDIAKELHLDELKIRALEKNDFAVLGAPVFAKGHLKKYAELVGVPVDDILADYYQLNRSAGAPPVVGPVRKFRRDIAWGPWAAGAILIMLVLGAVYWFFTRGFDFTFTQVTPASAVSRVAPAHTAAPQPEPVEAVASEPPPLPDRVEIAPATATAPLPTQAAATVTRADAPVQVPQVNVQLIYSGDCWTEVRDASGRSLFYDLGTEGRVVTLAGDEPLEVVLGASDNVSIAVEGLDYPIPDSARRGRMARLTIHSR